MTLSSTRFSMKLEDARTCDVMCRFRSGGGLRAVASQAAYCRRFCRRSVLVTTSAIASSTLSIHKPSRSLQARSHINHQEPPDTGHPGPHQY